MVNRHAEEQPIRPDVLIKQSSVKIIRPDVEMIRTDMEMIGSLVQMIPSSVGTLRSSLCKLTPLIHHGPATKRGALA
jgi:hypothetical protein